MRSRIGPSSTACFNVAAGADSGPLHNGGGVGIGYSTHPAWWSYWTAPNSPTKRQSGFSGRIPAWAFVRHVDAGYAEAKACEADEGAHAAHVKPDGGRRIAEPRPKANAARGKRRGLLGQCQTSGETPMDPMAATNPLRRKSARETEA